MITAAATMRGTARKSRALRTTGFSDFRALQATSSGPDRKGRRSPEESSLRSNTGNIRDADAEMAGGVITDWKPRLAPVDRQEAELPLSVLRPPTLLTFSKVKAFGSVGMPEESTPICAMR
mmetsp:Transcript_39160/g.80192  ORF Transcript_39160/g.80192 Transcript_39160/m.80192 type:complete len:121 (-) Transcript_39160:210-572(-)